MLMPTFPWRRAGPPVCALMIASCAGYPPPSAPAPPRLTLPEVATTPCPLARLPDSPTEADLEVAYMQRGGDLVACDAARQLAVDTLVAERALQDRWRKVQDGRGDAKTP
ncbi:MAG: hypothetical protein ACI9YM_001563 [Brevundimonas sp.]|jgi:hypothetical protein